MAVETYIAQSACVLMFISRGYFHSTNCLIEIRAAIKYAKPLILVYEPMENKGGGDLEKLKAECPPDVRAHATTSSSHASCSERMHHRALRCLACCRCPLAGLFIIAQRSPCLQSWLPCCRHPCRLSDRLQAASSLPTTYPCSL